MRMVSLSPSGNLGGAERVLLSVLAAVRGRWPAADLHLISLAPGPLLAAAERHGAQTSVLALPAPLAGLGDSQFKQANPWRRWRLLRSALAAVPGLALFVRRLRRELHRLRPDVIHSNGIKTHLLAGLARPAGAALVWHVHDFYSTRPLVKRLLTRLGRPVSAALAISAAVGRDLETLLPSIPITVVPNAVDENVFAPGQGDGAWLDGLAGLPQAPANAIRIGLVATYARWKGHGVFLEALGMLRQAHPELPFRGYVIGGPIYQTQGSQVTRDELESMAQRCQVSDHLGLVPFQSEPAPVYRALDVVVHASTQPEPFGLTIIEAMACGRAVVVSQAGGAVELFTPERDALGAPPGDPEALAGALLRLAQDAPLRQRLGAAARQTVCDRYRQERFAGQVAAFYEGLTADARAAYPVPGRGARLLDVRP